MVGVKSVVCVLVVCALVCGSQAAMYGAGNVMYKRYPNGPSEYHKMNVPVYIPTRRTLHPATSTRLNTQQQDSSWMFQRGDTYPAYEYPYFGQQ